MKIFKYIALLVLASTIQAENIEACKYYDNKLKEYYVKLVTAESDQHRLYSGAAYNYYVGRLEESYTNFEIAQTKQK